MTILLSREDARVGAPARNSVRRGELCAKQHCDSLIYNREKPTDIIPPLPEGQRISREREREFIIYSGRDCLPATRDERMPNEGERFVRCSVPEYNDPCCTYPLLSIRSNFWQGGEWLCVELARRKAPPLAANIFRRLPNGWKKYRLRYFPSPPKKVETLPGSVLLYDNE